MDADLQRKILEYEQKIFDCEMNHKFKIMRLENELFERDNEIRRAKFTLLQAFPELIGEDTDPNVDVLRLPGRLDKTIVERACLEKCLKDPSDHSDEETRKVRAEGEGRRVYLEWRSKIRDVNWQPYITGPDQGPGDIVQVERPDISNIKNIYGEELYHAIKIAWLEIQEGRRTSVHRKPWDYAAGREKTLTELMIPLRAMVQSLRSNH